MSDAVIRLQVVPDAGEFFDRVEAEALMKSDDEDSGEVLVITKKIDNDPANIDVLLLFPTEIGVASNKLTDGAVYQPTGIRIALNTLLNTARMLAIQHHAVIGKSMTDMPEAMTAEGLPQLIVPK